MALITAFVAIDAFDPSFTDFSGITGFSPSSTRVEISFSTGERDVFFGRGFTFNEEGVTGGTLERIDYFVGSTLALRIEGLSLPAAQISNGYISNNGDAVTRALLAGDDELIGSNQPDGLLGGDGNDVMEGRGGGDVMDGGSGTDIARYTQRFDQADLSTTSNGETRVVINGQADQLRNIERLDFADGDVILNFPGSPENIDLGYRLYAASLARTPDEAGLRFWVNALENGLTEREAAIEFSDNPEFERLFGGEDGVIQDAEYVTALFDNVLDRAPDQAGFDFWRSGFRSGDRDRAGMLQEFANSPENVDRTRPFIEDGVFVLAEDDLMM